jgi:putative membrane protein insertion efficiency factor
MVEKPFHTLWLAPRRTAIALVRLYQNTLSPDHGPLKQLYTYGYCRHSPTCSQYAALQLEKRGFMIGCLLAIARIVTCNPLKKPTDERLRELVKNSL